MVRSVEFENRSAMTAASSSTIHIALAGLRSLRFKKPPLTSGDDEIKSIFLDCTGREQDRYSKLFSYFISGFLYYRGENLSHVYYPGAPSCHGLDIDAMEGFCRVIPMISAWISSGRPCIVQDLEGRDIDLEDVVRRGLLSGTDPGSEGYWGHIRDYDQRMVEAADVAVSVWMMRDNVWARFSQPEKERTVKWLSEAKSKKPKNNNWHLFPVIINEVLRSLGFSKDQMTTNAHYKKIKSFYRGNGWFSDGPNDVYDYYNAWGIHYSLFWISLINPTLDPDFIDSSLNSFVSNYKYFFSTEGFPITGRSICYRMAAPAPLIAAVFKKLDCISPGMARKVLGSVWEYFIGRGALSGGRITQGYWQDDLNLLDIYSGPGSPMWSLRSLVLAFYCRPDSDLWTTPIEDLPVEKGDYEIFIPEIRWKITGCKHTREVRFTKMNNRGNKFRRIKSNPLTNLFAGFIAFRPFRPDNNYAKYKLYRYSSLHPFWEQSAK